VCVIKRLVPGGRALPDVTNHALEGLRGVPEGADAAVPGAVLRRRGLGLALRPAPQKQQCL